MAGPLASNACGAVIHCYSAGTVNGDGSVGGLVGETTVTVGHCYSSGASQRQRRVGGLVGSNSGDEPSDCYGYRNPVLQHRHGGSGEAGLVGGLVGCEH